MNPWQAFYFAICKAGLHKLIRDLVTPKGFTWDIFDILESRTLSCKHIVKGNSKLFLTCFGICCSLVLIRAECGVKSEI